MSGWLVVKPNDPPGGGGESDTFSLLWTMMQEDNQRFYGAHLMSKKEQAGKNKMPAQGKSCFNYRHMARKRRRRRHTVLPFQLLLTTDWDSAMHECMRVWMLRTCELVSVCVYVCVCGTVTDKKLSTWPSAITYAKFNFANENGARKGWGPGKGVESGMWILSDSRSHSRSHSHNHTITVTGKSHGLHLKLKTHPLWAVLLARPLFVLALSVCNFGPLFFPQSLPSSFPASHTLTN